MKSALICAGLVVMATVSEAIFDGGIISGPALLGLIGLKALAVKSFGVGAAIGAASRSRGGSRKGGRRHGRSLVDTEQLLLKVSYDDVDDCAKKMVCLINAKPATALDTVEMEIHSMFGQSGRLDVSQGSVEFDLAALMGRKAGSAQCMKIYARCQVEAHKLLDVPRSPSYINEI